MLVSKKERELAIEAALEAGRILMEKWERPFWIDNKGEFDLVTEADIESEKTIVSMIHETFPDHDILAEEGNSTNQKSNSCWIIDPLDGTTNFSHGFPWFAVSIALQREGEIVLGVVYNPCHRELFFAEKGEGAFLNQKRMHVSKISTLGKALLATGFPYDRTTCVANNYDHFVHFQQVAQACRRPGAASLDLAYTAAGRLDGYWEMKLKPWDMAAGKLLVEEAGGKTSDFDGKPLDVYGKECLVSNGLIHQAMIEILKQGNRP